MPARRLAEEYEYEYGQSAILPVRPKDPAARAGDEYARKRQELLLKVQRKRFRSKICVMLLAVTVLIGIIIYQNSLIAAKGYEIVKIRMEAVNLEAENARLRITNAHLKSPARIKEIATRELGMVIADRVYFADTK